MQPSTGPILGGILLALVVLFGLYIVIRLIRRDLHRKRKLADMDSEKGLDNESEKPTTPNTDSSDPHPAPTTGIASTSKNIGKGKVASHQQSGSNATAMNESRGAQEARVEDDDEEVDDPAVDSEEARQARMERKIRSKRRQKEEQEAKIKAEREAKEKAEKEAKEKERLEKEAKEKAEKEKRNKPKKKVTIQDDRKLDEQEQERRARRPSSPSSKAARSRSPTT